MSGASLAPPATADRATRSLWLTRDAADHLAVCNHLLLAERAHFGQQKTAKALYDVVVARYSSLATAALGRLVLPYLFPELSAFATIEDLVTHLRTSDTRYRAALPAEFLDRNPPPIESALPGTAPAEALLTFTLDSGAFRCFFRDTTTLTPISAPVPVRLADPSGGPVLARSSTVLPCPAVPSGSFSSLHLPSFSTNLVAASAQVSASGPVAAPCSCRLLSHQTLLWHHRLGHPSLPRLRGMHSRLLVSGLPRSLPPLPPSPAPPCLPCIKGLQRAAPHSSFPLTIAPLQTLHMDVWGPACVSGQDRERYVLLVVNDYTRFTTVFPLRNKGEGILQSFTLPASPQQNGIAERRIGLVVEVARTSKIHVAAPHFLWLFAVWYAAHQLNLWLGVSFPETLPTLHWTGKVGDASVFRVWGSRAFVRDSSVGELSVNVAPLLPHSPLPPPSSRLPQDHK
ncbi:unnamed protein product [Closterium sp. NIES-53]